MKWLSYKITPVDLGDLSEYTSEYTNLISAKNILPFPLDDKKGTKSKLYLGFFITKKRKIMCFSYH